MDNTFKAFRIHNIDGQIQSRFEFISTDQLCEGEVLIKVAYSDINYKDALAATGKGQILRRYPLVGGIDLSGIVEQSTDKRFKTGDEVLVTGAGLSETVDGGYSEYARVRADSIVALPDGITLFQAMAIGTAGFTAAIAIQRMEDNGQHPGLGKIIVTGATGGVGSMTINMLSGIGYDICAFTGKADQFDYLKSLGANELLSRSELKMGNRPLEKARWGGAVDSLGGETLSWLSRTVKPWGNIACIGLADGYKLETTVMPFILRGVSLLGISSIEMPVAVKNRAWQRLASDLKPDKLDFIANRTISFDDLPDAFLDYIEGAVTGRTVVKIGA